MLKVAIAGASGRMGRLLLEQVAGSDNIKLVGALEHAGSPELGGTMAAHVMWEEIETPGEQQIRAMVIA